MNGGLNIMKRRNKMNKQKIRSKALLGLPLTARERAMFLLFIATNEEMKAFLRRERGQNESER